MTDHLLDASVWVALSIEEHVHHDVSQAWFESLEPSASLLFCRVTQQAFLRLITTSALMGLYGLAPVTNEAAWARYTGLLGARGIAFRRDEPDGLEALWRRFAARASASPKLWMDAYLAAFARAGGYHMVTTDAAFRQFDELDLIVLGNDRPPA